MKKEKFASKPRLNTFLVGFSLGIALLSVLILMMFLRGDLKGLLAAGVGTGAPDVNARYLDGFGTVQGTTAANKIPVTDASGYLPDNSVDSGAIIDGAVTSADIADGAVTSADIADGAVTSADIANEAVTKAKLSNYAAGNILTAASNSERVANSTSYVKLKEIIIDRGGTLRIKFDLRSYNGNYYVYAAIYRNGTRVGTVRSTNSTNYVTYSEDISGWSPNDRVQLYAKTITSGYLAYVRNFQIYTTGALYPVVTQD